MRTWRNASSLAVFIAVAVTAPACATREEEEVDSSADALGEGQTFLDDGQIDLTDLVRLGNGFITNEVNSRLKEAGAPISTGLTCTVFSKTDLPEVSNEDRVDRLVSGLAQRYGEQDLTVRVNRLRAASSARFWTETTFTTNLIATPAIPLTYTGTFPHNLRVEAGIMNPSVQFRVITPHTAANANTVMAAPIGEIARSRAFVLPTSLADLRQLRAGEVMALRATGQLAVNLGVGAPIAVAPIGPGLTYQLAFSAGVRTAIRGTFDVQLVKLENDADNAVVVDVGVTNGTTVTAQAALTTGFGVRGLTDTLAGGTPAIGGTTLGTYLDRAIQRRLDQVTRMSIGASRGTGERRTTLMRFKFRLGQNDSGFGSTASARTEGANEMASAIAQALRGDVRLAQALAYRDELNPNGRVSVELDMIRAAAASTSSFGFELFGVNIYSRTTTHDVGSVTVNDAAGIRTIFFDALQDARSSGNRDHSYLRVALAGQGQANLFMRTIEGANATTTPEVFLDSMDAALFAIGGWEQAYLPLERNRAVDSMNVSALDRNVQALVRAVGEKRLAPPTARDSSFTFDFMADSSVIDGWASRATGTANGPLAASFRDTGLNFLAAVRLNRNGGTIENAWSGARTYESALLTMGNIFNEHMANYRALTTVEGTQLATTRSRTSARAAMPGAFVPAVGARMRMRNAIELRTGSGNDAELRSRADILASMIDAMIARADGFDDAVRPLHKEQLVAVPLLALVPKNKLDVAVKYKPDTGAAFIDIAARAPGVAPITPGYLGIAPLFLRGLGD